MIHPYDNENIIAGAGTAALELFEEVGDLDLIVTPVGGGGLISGTALAAALKAPNCQVLGVEPKQVMMLTNLGVPIKWSRLIMCRTPSLMGCVPVL